MLHNPLKPRNAYKILVGNVVIDGKRLLKLILNKKGVRVRMDSCGSGWGPDADSCGHVNKPSVSKIDGEIVDQLSDC